MGEGVTGMQKSALAVLGLAAIVLIALAVVGQFSYVLRTTTTIDELDITLGAVNASTLVGTTGQYPYLQSVTDCLNSSNAATLSTSYYSVTEGDTDGGYITLNDDGAAWATEDVNCTTVYLADSTPQGAADKFTAGLTIFGTFMAVIVLALVGKIIIGLFKKE